jgi:VanZ family protein
LKVDLYDFNWIPFSSQMTENVSGIGSIIDGIWPFTAIGFFAIAHASSGRKIHAFSSSMFLVVGVVALEYYQKFIPGRYPDITTVMLAVVGWGIPFLVYRESNS